MVKQLIPKHIIITDDDEDDRMLFAEALEEIELPVVVTEASNGAELMDILHKEPVPVPEVVFLDLNMPVKDGFECLQEIRKEKGDIKDLNIVVLSTSSNKATIDKCFELGASYYGVKPHSFGKLKELLSSVLAMDWNTYEKPDRAHFVLEA